MKRKFSLLPLLLVFISSCSFNIASSSNNENHLEISNISHTTDSVNTDIKEEQEDKPGTIKVTSVSLNKNSISLYESDSEQLSFTILPTNATNKDVKWESSNPIIASVENGLVKAWNEGSATIIITTLDQSKVAKCIVTVSKKPAPQIETTTSTLVFNNLGYTSDITDYTSPVEIDENISIKFDVGTGSNKPACYKGSNTKKYEARAYAGNTFTITSSDGNIRKVVLTFSTDKPGTNEITTDVGSFAENIWTGSSKSIVFSVGGTSGHRRISSVEVT